MLKTIVMFCMLAAVPTAHAQDKSSKVVCSIKQDGTILECSYPPQEKPPYLKRLFAAENLPNILLVGIGIFGVGSALATLRVIRQQAVSMSEQTKQMVVSSQATQTQVTIQRESLRPRLSVRDFANNAYIEAAAGKQITIKMQIANSGGIPAYDVVPESWIEFVKRATPGDPFVLSTDALYQKSPSLHVDTGSPQLFEIFLNRTLTSHEVTLMQKALGAICFRIRLTYMAFNEERHYDHAFAMTPGQALVLEQYNSMN